MAQKCQSISGEAMSDHADRNDRRFADGFSDLTATSSRRTGHGKDYVAALMIVVALVGIWAGLCWI
jgi:hypothetical protein